jgi:hypothetical protein
MIDPKISAMKRLYNAQIDVYKAEAEDKLIVLETRFNG